MVLAPAGRGDKGSATGVLAARVGSAAALLCAWEVAAARGWISPFFFSRPSAITRQLAAWLAAPELYRHLLVTSGETVLGLVIGVVLGVGLGAAFALSPRLDAIYGPWMVLLNALPRMVLFPLFIIWFGVGVESKVAMAVVIVVFVVFFNTYDGVRDVDRNTVANALVLGASRAALVRHVLLPSAMIWILSSLRTSVGFALVGAVIGEYIVASQGMGYLIHGAQANFDTTAVFAGFAVLMALVWALNLPVRLLQRHLARWKRASV